MAYTEAEYMSKMKGNQEWGGLERRATKTFCCASFCSLSRQGGQTVTQTTPGVGVMVESWFVCVYGYSAGLNYRLQSRGIYDDITFFYANVFASSSAGNCVIWQLIGLFCSPARYTKSLIVLILSFWRVKSS